MRNHPTDTYRFLKENFYHFKSNNDKDHVTRSQQNMVYKKYDQLMAKIFEETFGYKDKDIFGNERKSQGILFATERASLDSSH